MAQVPVYRNAVQEAAPQGDRFQAFDHGDGGASGIQAVARGLGQFAQGVEQYRVKVDEAAVNDMDSQLANTVRPIEREFLNAKGKNAVDMAEASQKAWDQAAQSLARQAATPRQAAMFNRVMQARRERWNGL